MVPLPPFEIPPSFLSAGLRILLRKTLPGHAKGAAVRERSFFRLNGMQRVDACASRYFEGETRGMGADGN